MTCEKLKNRIKDILANETDEEKVLEELAQLIEKENEMLKEKACQYPDCDCGQLFD